MGKKKKKKHMLVLNPLNDFVIYPDKTPQKDPGSSPPPPAL